MAFKLFVFAAVVAVARAGVVGAPGVVTQAYSTSYASPVVASHPVAYAAPAHYAHATYAAPVQHVKTVAPVAYAAPVHHVKTVEYEAPAEYSYGYSVQDPLTGDSKSQHETRHGDAVQGSYSLVDADGHKRTVDYTADGINGFNAVVRREPLVHAVKVATPVVAKVAAPVSYAAPVHYAAAPVVTKTVAPVAYAAPAHYATAHYAAGAPVVAKTVAPVAYAAPAHFAHTYAATPVVAKSVAYAAPVQYAAHYGVAPQHYTTYHH